MNKICLIGNLTKDPEFSLVKDEYPLCKFSIAVNRPYSNDDVDFFNIIVWRKQAENCNKYLSKGKKVGVSGYVQIRNYETAEGEKRSITEVVANEVEFLTPKSSGSDDSSYVGALEEIPATDGNLPF